VPERAKGVEELGTEKGLAQKHQEDRQGQRVLGVLGDRVAQGVQQVLVVLEDRQQIPEAEAYPF